MNIVLSTATLPPLGYLIVKMLIGSGYYLGVN